LYITLFTAQPEDGSTRGAEFFSLLKIMIFIPTALRGTQIPLEKTNKLENNQL